MLACGGVETPDRGIPERIVLIVVDTLRRDHVGVYGAERPTPNFDRIAASGTVFRNAFSSFHATSMSMGALFTGRTPSLESGRGDEALEWTPNAWCGMARFFGPEDDPRACIPSALPVLGEALSDRGYWTLGVTPHDLIHRPFGFDRGFKAWVEVKLGHQGVFAFRRGTWPRFAAARSGERVNRAVIPALDARESDRFFLYVHYLDVHDWAMRGASYAEAVTAADAATGALLDALDARGLLEGTAVILTSDHGEAQGEQHYQPASPKHVGNPAFEPLLRVPLIIGGVDLEAEADDFLRSEDVFRLLLRLAGGGDDTQSDLADDELFVTERVYRTFRRGRWKSFWLRGGDRVRLVDLEADPMEVNDLAANRRDVVEAHRERINELSRTLAAPDAEPAEMLPMHLERLRALGYLEPEYRVD